MGSQVCRHRSALLTEHTRSCDVHSITPRSGAGRLAAHGPLSPGWLTAPGPPDQASWELRIATAWLPEAGVDCLPPSARGDRVWLEVDWGGLGHK